ncbi:MAG: iron-containing alcohol dehydrogenase [Alicyclobacillus sp.]|nr:iron-containing alcohol dehydrogenase [Alicyclobacillus sp.]
MEFKFTLPTKVDFGSGSISRIKEYLDEFRVTNVFLVTDRGLHDVGLLEPIYRLMDKHHVNYIVFDEVKPNPRDVDCDRAAKVARDFGSDGILAVGGGSVMDTAKGVAVLLTHGGSINDWEGANTLHHEVTPLVCVPTTAGTGSEVTFFSVITDTTRKYKMSIYDPRLAPRVAILDPELTLRLPPLITASTGMDALTHAIEAYTCRLASPITDALALHAIAIIRDNLVSAVKQGDLNSRTQMLSASLLAGMAFGNSDVASVHCLAESLGGLYDTPHGIANSVFLPHVFRYNVVADIRRHADVAYALGADRNLSMEAACEVAVTKLFELTRTVGIPRFRDLPNVNPKDFPLLAEAAKRNISDPSNARDTTIDDYLDILYAAYMDSTEEGGQQIDVC